MSALPQKLTQPQNKGSAVDRGVPVACVICHAAAPQIRQATSPSGRLTKIRTARITVVMRNAASWPFHSFDCHIAKYSPAMTMKPRNQRAKPTVNPATAQTLERLKTLAAP